MYSTSTTNMHQQTETITLNDRASKVVLLWLSVTRLSVFTETLYGEEDFFCVDGSKYGNMVTAEEVVLTTIFHKSCKISFFVVPFCTVPPKYAFHSYTACFFPHLSIFRSFNICFVTSAKRFVLVLYQRYHKTRAILVVIVKGGIY